MRWALSAGNDGRLTEKRLIELRDLEWVHVHCNRPVSGGRCVGAVSLRLDGVSTIPASCPICGQPLGREELRSLDRPENQLLALIRSMRAQESPPDVTLTLQLRVG